MSTILFLIFILIFVGIITEKMNRVLPIVFVLFIVLIFKFGINLLLFLIGKPWLLLILIVFYFLNKRNKPKVNRNQNYYYYSSKEPHQDFEDFFKNTGGYAGGGSSRNRNDSGNVFQETGATSEDYSRLGIRKGATKEEVKKAYREKVKINHPDKFASESEEKRVYQEKIIKEINESYEKISKELE